MFIALFFFNFVILLPSLLFGVFMLIWQFYLSNHYDFEHPVPQKLQRRYDATLAWGFKIILGLMATLVF